MKEVSFSEPEATAVTTPVFFTTNDALWLKRHLIPELLDLQSPRSAFRRSPEWIAEYAGHLNRIITACNLALGLPDDSDYGDQQAGGTDDFGFPLEPKLTYAVVWQETFASGAIQCSETQTSGFTDLDSAHDFAFQQSLKQPGVNITVIDRVCSRGTFRDGKRL